MFFNLLFMFKKQVPMSSEEELHPSPGSQTWNKFQKGKKGKQESSQEKTTNLTKASLFHL